MAVRKLIILLLYYQQFGLPTQTIATTLTNFKQFKDMLLAIDMLCHLCVSTTTPVVLHQYLSLSTGIP